MPLIDTARGHCRFPQADTLHAPPLRRLPGCPSCLPACLPGGDFCPFVDRPRRRLTQMEKTAGGAPEGIYLDRMAGRSASVTSQARLVS